MKLVAPPTPVKEAAVALAIDAPLEDCSVLPREGHFGAPPSYGGAESVIPAEQSIAV